MYTPLMTRKNHCTLKETKCNLHYILEQIFLFGKMSLKSEVKVKSLSRVQLFAAPWTVARQAPLSMEFSRQEYWSGA